MGKALIGWRAVLVFLSKRPQTGHSIAQVGAELGCVPGAAWILLERCRLYSTVRAEKDAGRKLYFITKKGKSLVEAGFRREKA